VIQDDINQGIDRCNSLAQTRTNFCYELNYVKILKCKNVNSHYNETGYILTNRASIVFTAILQQAYICRHFQTTQRVSTAALQRKVVMWKLCTAYSTPPSRTYISEDGYYYTSAQKLDLPSVQKLWRLKQNTITSVPLLCVLKFIKLGRLGYKCEADITVDCESTKS